MLLSRVLVVALLVACACFVRAAEVPELDINNEVLPEKDVDEVRARVDEVPQGDATSELPSSSRNSDTTQTSTSVPEDKPEAKPEDKVDVPPTSTTAPPRATSTLSRFLSDIIEIPIAVLRSVSSLLSNTFSRHGNSNSTSSDSTVRT